MEIGIIESAFQLAKESHDIEEVRSKLEREGYPDEPDSEMFKAQ